MVNAIPEWVHCPVRGMSPPLLFLAKDRAAGSALHSQSGVIRIYSASISLPSAFSAYPWI